MSIHMPDVAPPSLADSVLERRSIRRFAPDPVARATVADLLERSCWAPSPHNSQPWRFTVLFGQSDKDRLASAMADRLEEDLRVQSFAADEIERQSRRSRSRITAAPVVILCSLTDDGLAPHADDRMRSLEWGMAVQSVGAVLQSLFLLAHREGLGTCWMAAPMYCPESVREVLALPPTYEPQALVLLGYPDGPGKRRLRRPLSEVIDLR